MKKIAMIVLMTAVMAVVAAPKAEAAAITGGIGFVGAAVPTDASGNPISPLNWAAAGTKGIQFTSAAALSGSGAYASVPAFTTATFTNFIFDPFGGVTPLWTFTVGGNTYSFDFTSITSITKTGDYSSNSLEIRGMGTLKATGYDDTSGTFIFTGNGANGAGFTFSASDAAATVPEPGTMVLFGTGLLGVAAAARRLRKA